MLTSTICALGYFGSYAGSEANENSDVDIVFDTGSPNLFGTVVMQQDLGALERIPRRFAGINSPSDCSE